MNTGAGTEFIFDRTCGAVQTFVDFAIAVVVDAIADLIGRNAANVIFVGLTIAVIIDAIADFFLQRASFNEGAAHAHGRIVFGIVPAAFIFIGGPIDTIEAIAIKEVASNTIGTAAADIHFAIAVDIAHTDRAVLSGFIPSVAIAELFNFILFFKPTACGHEARKIGIGTDTEIVFAVAIDIAKVDGRIVVVIAPSVFIGKVGTSEGIAPSSPRRKVA